MSLIQDVAIVLKRLDYSESSQILALFSKNHGKVRVIAKGARRSTKKRFSPGIDLLESGEAFFSVRHVRQEALATLTDWTPAPTYWGLRDALDRLNAAQYAADIVASLTEDWDPHPALYNALDTALQTFASGHRPLSALVSFQRTLLIEAGVWPRLDGCVSCDQTNLTGRDIYFSSFEGGLICRDCEPARVEKRLVRVSPVTLASDSIPDSDVPGAFDLFNYHLSHLMGRAPAAAGFFQPATPPSRGR